MQGKAVKMNWYILLSCIGACLGCAIPKFNFTISNLQQNETGEWFAQAQFNFQGKLPLHFYIDDKNITDAATIESAIDIAKEEESSPTKEKHEITVSGEEVPLDYEFVPTLGYYKVYTNRKDWQDSLDFCAHEGGHLLILNSEQEAQAVINLIQKENVTKTELWVGVHDQFENRNYVTIFNETLSSTGYTRWYPGDPWGNSNQNCISFRYESSTSYGLRDWGCKVLYPFICEKEL